MTDSIPTIMRLLRDDPRYKLGAYLFVRDSLSYAQQILGLGRGEARSETAKKEPERHLTGQQLCEAARQYAIDQYGYLSKIVLNAWGIRSTSDLGEIVYNLIQVRLMKKSRTDRREDFNDVFDFDDVFQRQFQFQPQHAQKVERHV